jgi:hypothetical protein
MTRNHHSKRATAIHWLSVKKNKGKARLIELAKQDAKGAENLRKIRETRHYLDAVELLLEICINCPLELSELLEVVKQMRVAERQTEMFKNPV